MGEIARGQYPGKPIIPSGSGGMENMVRVYNGIVWDPEGTEIYTAADAGSRLAEGVGELEELMMLKIDDFPESAQTRPVAYNLSETFFEGKVDYDQLNAAANRAGYDSLEEWAAANAKEFNQAVQLAFRPNGLQVVGESNETQ